MARPLRIEYPGAVYHLTARGNARQKIFRDDTDRVTFLATLSHVISRYRWLCHAYCLMDTTITCWSKLRGRTCPSGCARSQRI